jgi:hypothetical protein
MIAPSNPANDDQNEVGDEPSFFGNDGGNSPGSTSGGQGVVIDTHHKRQHLKMIDRAVRQSWAIRDKAFEKLPKEMLDLAMKRSEDPRVRVSAARVIVTMHGQNLGENPAGNTTINNYGTTYIERMESAPLDAIEDYIAAAERLEQSVNGKSAG